MGYKYQCSLTAQDCATLYANRNSTTRPLKLAFTARSCVRDARLEGNVGRCGFSGAPCVLQGNGMDNCAGGGDSAYVGYKQICIPDAPGSSMGTCSGQAGDKCTGNVECNWGMSCNNTYSQGIFTAGVCGGANSYMNNNEAADGLDFGRDYCLSGKAHQDPKTDYWLCSEGPPMALTVAPSPVPSPTPQPNPSKKSNVGLIAGPVVAVLLLAVALAAFLLVRRRRSRSRRAVESAATQKRHTDVDEKAGQSIREQADASSADAGDAGPHAQDGADRRPAVPRVAAAVDQRHRQHNMDGRGEGETEEEWLERMMRASSARMAALDAMKTRLDERRQVEARMDGSDGLVRARS